jgi:hypothetical protein
LITTGLSRKNKHKYLQLISTFGYSNQEHNVYNLKFFFETLITFVYLEILGVDAHSQFGFICNEETQKCKRHYTDNIYLGYPHRKYISANVILYLLLIKLRLFSLEKKIWIYDCKRSLLPAITLKIVIQFKYIGVHTFDNIGRQWHRPTSVTRNDEP